MKKTLKKLQLSRETLRTVTGGTVVSYGGSCNVSCDCGPDPGPSGVTCGPLCSPSLPYLTCYCGNASAVC